MGFDQTTRNRLARFVGDARDLLTAECTRQLQQDYGIDPAGGEVADLKSLTGKSDAQYQTAQLLRETAQHYLPGFAARPARERGDTLDRIVREQAFTVLNRLAALRMAEARGLLIESIAAGYQSRGFQLYSRLAGAALGETGDAYRCYLFSLFDELAVDLPVLFARFAPEGRLFPGETALLQLLGMINHPEIADLWAEDETLGWVYQYFNSQDERKAMRAASAAPRNSRELAVRNQFFTPRYVVEFLADNTLGRTWYEMTRGQTGLIDSCRYLVRRPNEVFSDQLSVASAGSERLATDHQPLATDLSQAELLQQPVHIPHRPLKDPRGILMLDPACGSMHFGLYAFDLFERIYDEAWEIEAERGPAALERVPLDAPLHEVYASKEAFLRDVPRLIVERNIHGVDIDPRAVQIAGLSLWLRAQRSWREQGIKAQDRPEIRRSNVVCAEPMPGDPALLEEFIARQLAATPEDRVVGQMLRRVFSSMELAGEAGSLLKIEEEIREVIAEGKKAWLRGPRYAQGSMFGEEAPKIRQGAFDLDATGVTDETFWGRAEDRVIAALRAYAENAENGGSYRRRLFADDATQGFAFIDLCRRRYDVVLMNPPFGSISDAVSIVAKSDRGSDVDALFTAMAVERLRGTGYFGIITNRTQLLKPALGMFRRENLIRRSSIQLCADLGNGVLDAMVEVAAFTSRKSETISDISPSLFLSCLNTRSKEESVSDFPLLTSSEIYIVSGQFFLTMPDFRFSYWLHHSLANLLIENRQLVEDQYISFGLSTTDNFRFLRLFWEVAVSSIQVYRKDRVNEGWIPLAKGGDYSPYAGDIHLLVDWHKNGSALRSMPGAPIRNEELYGLPGLTYTKRTASAFAPRVLPAGCIPEVNGTVIIPRNTFSNDSMTILTLCMSRVASYITDVLVAAGDTSFAYGAAKDYIPGVIGKIPLPKTLPSVLSSNTEEIVKLKRQIDLEDETHNDYLVPVSILHREMINRFKSVAEEKYTIKIRVLRLSAENDKLLESVAYALSDDASKVLDRVVGPLVGSLENTSLELDRLNRLMTLSTEEIVSNLLQGGITRKDISKNSFRVDRRLELLSSLLNIDAEVIARHLLDSTSDASLRTFEEISYCLGAVIGRWDIRYATGERAAPELPDAFAPLPVCPPGMLQNAQGLPAAPEDVPASYPLRISWPGILVDDAGHAEDIAGRVREAIGVIWGARAEAIEQEACEILGVKSLRDYLARPASFFADHLSRYSKSRRQAPIYWPLSTPSGSYTLWLYYHRLTDQTLYSCVNDFVDPKLRVVSEQWSVISQKPGRTAREEKELEQLGELQRELSELRAELLRVASFWKPNLNDGVQITAAPLWRLFQHRPWQKKLKETWENLERGEYDWAHLAYSVWPARVRDKCKADKSLAIAHGLEELYVEVAAAGKKGRGRKKPAAEDGGMFDE